MSTASVHPMEASPILSTPKLEISWKELSVLLKCGEAATPRLQEASTLAARSPFRSTSSRKLDLQNYEMRLCPTPTRNQIVNKPDTANMDTMNTPPSIARSRRRSYSRSPALLLSSSRMTRLEQSRAARRLLDSISPDIFMQQDASEHCVQSVQYTESAATNSPAHVRTPRSSSSCHKSQPKIPSSARKNVSSAVRSMSFNSLTPPRHPHSARKLLQSLSID
jgi:hypothetical protein